ncbi:MAG: hypothetical protein ACLTZB_03405 [Streptococcus salivarius]
MPNSINRDSIYQQDGNIITLVALVSSTNGYFVFDVPKKVLQKQANSAFLATGEMAVGLTHAGGGLQYFDKWHQTKVLSMLPDGKLCSSIKIQVMPTQDTKSMVSGMIQ